jgi:Septum formation
VSDQPSSGSTRPGGTGVHRSVPPRPRSGEPGGAPVVDVRERVFGSMDRSSRRLELPGLVVTAERAPRPQRRDPVAVAAVVCGVVALAPLAIVLGAVALVRGKRTGNGGSRTLAITGIALGVLWSVGFLAVFGVAVLLGHRFADGVTGLATADRSSEAVDVAGTTTAASQVQQGACIAGWDPAAALGGSDPDVVVVDCTTPHRAQAYAQVDLSEDYPESAVYPGADVLGSSGTAVCTAQVAVSLDPDRAAGLGVAVIVPTSEAWAGGTRSVTCVAVADRDLTTSVTL